MTLDNCTTNDSMVGLMETRLGANHMLLRGRVLHMRYCAHILNLIVRDGIQIITDSIAAIRDRLLIGLLHQRGTKNLRKQPWMKMLDWIGR
jgi:hypothetical protein